MLALCLGAALVYKLSSAYKWLYAYLCFVFCVEVTGIIIGAIYQMNVWLYNVSYVVYLILFLTVYYKIAKKGYSHLVLLFILYLVSWGINLYISGINVFFKIPSILMSCSLVFLYCLLLFNETINFRGKLYLSPLFIVCVGIIINQGCLVPYYAFIDLLSREIPEESLNLIFTVHGFFTDIFYLCILVSLYLNYRENMKQRLNEVTTYQ